ncbi:MAG: hypothetical protein AAFW47_02770 [Pseudomonadota bacterium]
MLSKSFNELAWHFAGYIHLSEDLATLRTQYGANDAAETAVFISAPDVLQNTDGFDQSEAPQTAEIGGLPTANEVAQTNISSIPDAPALFIELDDLLPGIEQAIAEALEVADSPEGDAAAASDTPTDTGLLISIPPFDLSAAAQVETLQAQTLNEITDNDVIIQSNIDAGSLTSEPVETLLTTMADAQPDGADLDALLTVAEAQTPAPLRLDLGEELEGKLISAVESLSARFDADDAEAEGTPSEGGAEAPADFALTTTINVEQGTAVSGNAVQNVEAEPEDIDAPEDGEDGGDTPAEDAEVPDATLHTGGNEAFNEATITDTSIVESGLIVLGDYSENNAIVQTNIYSFNDNVDVDDLPALDEVAEAEEEGIDLPDPANTVHNGAGFFDELDDVVLELASGGAPTTSNFSIDFVDGDFYDLNVLNQTNHLVDNDAVAYQTATSQFFIETGGNIQINTGSISDFYEEYDFIFVGGDFNELNIIEQVNIVLDLDTVLFDDAFDTVAELNDNTLLNSATITNVGGGELFQPLSDPKQFGNIEESLPFDALRSFTDTGAGVDEPVDFLSQQNVLFITGDYYQLNAIYQTNVISDGDIGLIVEGTTLDEADTSFETGGNIASNQATIIDHDSQSDFQLLGGEFYEQDILIQVDILAASNDAQGLVANGATTALAPELVAFTGDDAGPGVEEQQQLFTVTSQTANDADMMGSLMA